MIRSRKAATIAGVATVLAAGALAWVETRPPKPSTTMKQEHDAKAEAEVHSPGLPTLVLLHPGTVVAEGKAPEGWSHPVIKSILHLASGDIDSLPASAKVTATLFHTVVLADVRREPGGYRLRRVGAGLSMLHDGEEIVVDSAGLGGLGVSLSTLDGLVLGRAERALGRGRFVAATPTFAVYESPVEFADEGGGQHSILLRYAMLVDPESGSLRTACWPIDEAPARQQPPDSLRLLPPSLVFRCGIQVSARRALGVPYSWGFAMTSLPPGRAIPLSDGLADWTTRTAADEAESRRMERAVREAIDGAKPAP